MRADSCGRACVELLGEEARSNEVGVVSDTAAPVLPISVVIPAFKAARFIGEALDSVAAQTTQPSEVIVVDDGSPDHGAVLARDRGATVITRNREGVSAARNAGILASGQPWIAFLDADDIWEPRKLEQQWRAVEHYPDLGAVFCDYTEFDNHGTSDRTFLSRKKHFHAIKRHEIAPNVMLCDERSLQQQFFKGNFIVPSTMLVRRDLLVQVVIPFILRMNPDELRGTDPLGSDDLQLLHSSSPVAGMRSNGQSGLTRGDCRGLYQLAV